MKLTSAQLRELINEVAGKNAPSMLPLIAELKNIIDRMEHVESSNDVNVCVDNLFKAYINLKQIVLREEKTKAVFDASKKSKKEKGHFIGSRWVPED